MNIFLLCYTIREGDVQNFKVSGWHRVVFHAIFYEHSSPSFYIFDVWFQGFLCCSSSYFNKLKQEPTPRVLDIRLDLFKQCQWLWLDLRSSKFPCRHRFLRASTSSLRKREREREREEDTFFLMLWLYGQNKRECIHTECRQWDMTASITRAIDSSWISDNWGHNHEDGSSELNLFISWLRLLTVRRISDMDGPSCDHFMLKYEKNDIKLRFYGFKKLWWRLFLPEL